MLQKLLFEYNGKAFVVHTVLKETLGYGSGKEFREEPEGQFNFDTEETVDLLTNEKVNIEK